MKLEYAYDSPLYRVRRKAIQPDFRLRTKEPASCTALLWYRTLDGVKNSKFELNSPGSYESVVVRIDE